MSAARACALLGVGVVVSVGCAPADPCPPASPSASCIVLHVEGELGRVDALEIQLRGVIERDATRSFPDGVRALPVTVAVLLPARAGSADVGLLARAGGQVVGVGHATAALTSGGDTVVSAVLRAASGPACDDQLRDGDETDRDCGGGCPACATGAGCGRDADCASGACAAGRCAASPCTDGARDGRETDVDCGASCSPCGDGRGCVGATDCASAVCTSGVCAAPTCADGAKNGGEADVDCGGPCASCGDGRSCARADDCVSAVCLAMRCAAATCGDGRRNGGESDTDCGGPCPRCADGRACRGPDDCASARCVAAACASASCADQIRNGSESDVDCGGTCPSPCGDGKLCAAPGDCASGVCASGRCAAPACGDGVLNGAETGKDCGGACPPCADAEPCRVGADCRSGVCAQKRCAVPSCQDGVRNGAETDQDCGGPCPACHIGAACAVDGDCDARACQAGHCAFPFAAPAAQKIGGQPIDLIAGRLDGDLKPDLAVARAGDDRIEVFLGRGDGSFASAGVTSAGAPVAALAVSDLDSDSHLDVVAVSTSGQSLTLLQGLGDGRLVSYGPAAYGMMVDPVAVVAQNLDLRNDSFPDLAVACRRIGGVAIHHAQGQGLFGIPRAALVGNGPEALVAGDFTGDGIADLATCDAAGQSVSVLVGIGDASFAPAVTTPLGFACLGLSAGDLDRDGRADLLVSVSARAGKTGSSVAALLSTGGGKLMVLGEAPVAANPRRLALVDLDRDGLLDAAVPSLDTGAVSLLRGRGDGTFAPAGALVGGASTPLVIAVDLDGDGRPDLVATDPAGGTLIALLNRTP